MTLRHTASMEQVRLKVGSLLQDCGWVSVMPILFQVVEVGETVEELVKGRMQWTDVTKKFPVFAKKEEEEEEED